MRLIIPAEVEAKLHAYVRSVNTEIAGMGKAKVDDEGNIMMLDVAIYDQEVTGGTADLSTLALAKFQTELIQAGESPKDWIVWWHSHADMAAFFSGRDTSTIDSSDEFQFLVSLVVNRRRDRKARLDLYHPFRFTKDDLEIIVGSADEVIPQEIRDEVAAKVHIKAWGAWGGGQRSLGFGKHKVHDETEHGGKGYPAKRSDDYASSESGKEIIVIGESTYLDNNEIHSIIDALREKVREHERLGTSESDECVEAVNEIADWEYELVVRNDDDEVSGKIFDFSSKK